MDQLAAGVFHEMGHGSSLGHANVLDTTSAIIEYADIYDYMGGMTSVWRRFNPRCLPSGITSASFAPATEIHLNPIHKWHHDWLDDAEIVRVTQSKPPVYKLRSIDDRSNRGAPRAVEIDLGFETGPKGNLAPVSLLVYWRQNEPLVRDGVCVAIVSRQLLSYTTRLLEFAPGPTSCTIRGNNEFAGYYGRLTPGPPVRLSNPYASGPAWVDIECKGLLSTTGEMQVEITLPSQVFQFQDLPIFDLISPAAESRRVLTNTDLIDVAVDAAVPNASKLPWHMIDRVECDFRIGDGPLANTFLTVAGSKGQTPWVFSLNASSVKTLLVRHLEQWALDPNLGPFADTRSRPASAWEPACSQRRRRRSQ